MERPAITIYLVVFELRLCVMGGNIGRNIFIKDHPVLNFSTRNFLHDQRVLDEKIIVMLCFVQEMCWFCAAIAQQKDGKEDCLSFHMISQWSKRPNSKPSRHRQKYALNFEKAHLCYLEMLLRYIPGCDRNKWS